MCLVKKGPVLWPLTGGMYSVDTIAWYLCQVMRAIDLLFIACITFLTYRYVIMSPATRNIY